jgi:AraC-like DNA-binding protein
MQASFITAYIDKIISVENDTYNFQDKIVMPDNSIVLAFQCGKPISEKIDEKQWPLSGSNVFGQMTRSKKYVYPSGCKTIIVKFKSWAASSFLNNNLDEYTDRSISLSSISDKYFAATAGERITSSLNTKEIVMDILSQMFNYKAIDKSVLLAINIINQSNGRIKVADLAYMVCNSKRNFERKFKDTTGLTPKKFIANTRFRTALQLIGRNYKLSNTAYYCGYYDQAHFIHDIKSITGFTPEKILAELCRIFPMTAPGFTSSLRHKLLFQN